LGGIGDSGIITTNNKNYAQTLRSMRNYGEENFINYTKRKYKNLLKGFNSRMSEINAVLLNLKIKDLKKNNLKKSQKAKYYLQNIKNKKITLPQVKNKSFPVWHQFLILSTKRNKLKKHLKKNGFETKIVYPIPPHKQLAYKEMNKISYPITERIHNQNLCLPIEQHLEKKDLKKIVKLINEFK
jgi:dTDP-4-amino-4,6-dideoxygalactose transaminase